MKIVTLFLCVFALTGCAGYGINSEMSDLQRMQRDCPNQAEQIAFLNSQLTTSDERMLQVFNFFGDQEHRYAVLSREHDAQIRASIATIETTCPQ